MMILVKLLQVIWGYVACCGVSVCLFFCIFERQAFHIVMLLCHLQHLILVGPGIPVVRAMKIVSGSGKH